MNNEVVAMALRMIGKNIMIIADCIHKDEEPAAAEEKPKKKTRKTAKAKTEEEAPAEICEAEPVLEEAEKPKVTFEQVRAALANKARSGYTDAVRNLVGNYGAEKLSEIKPEHYAEILEQAELIGYE